MNQPTFILDEEQLNRLFPFYILIGPDLTIRSCGKSLKKLRPQFSNTSLDQLIELQRPQLDELTFDHLMALRNQLVILQIRIGDQISLRGQFEYFSATHQLLFVGTPWFGSVEQVKENNLTLLDFAFHDPLIDLLHILKTQEITNDELKQLLEIVSKQKNSLKGAARQFELVSLAASTNKNAVLFFDADRKIIWANAVCKDLLGYSAKDILGLSAAHFYGPETDAAALKFIEEKIFHKENFTSELLIYRPDGTTFWAQVEGTHVPLEGNDNWVRIATLEDITAERKKRKKIERISLVASANKNGVVFTDAFGKITWVNEGFCKLTGFTIDEILGQTPIQLCHGPLTNPDTLNLIVKAFTQSESYDHDLIHYRKDGSWFWGRSKGQPIIDQQQQTGFFAIIEDITTSKELSEKLSEYEKKLRLALKAIGDNIWEHDFRTGITYFSKSNNEFLGVEATDESQNEKLWWDSVHPEDKPMLVRNDQRIRNKEIDSHSMEYRMIRKDWEIRWVLDRGAVIEKDSSGNPLRIIGTHTDITKIKQTEAELASRVTQFKSLSESIPAVIYEFVFKKDGSQQFRYVSPAVEKVFGIPVDVFFSKEYFQYMHPDDRAEIQEKNLHSRLTLEPFEYEVRLMIPNKGVVWASISSSATSITEEGDAVFTGLMLNTTDRKNAEQALRINEEKYRNIISNMNLGLLEVDLHDVVTHLPTNRSAPFVVIPSKKF